MTKHVVICCPTIAKPAAPFLKALEASIPILEEAGWTEGSVYEIGCPYISHARSKMLRKALDANADVIVFLDHDLSWDPEDLRILIETPGDVVAGTYRFKRDSEDYMGQILPGAGGKPIVREDGAVLMHSIPAGFLKVTREGVRQFMRSYPQLLFGPPEAYFVDLFNHGCIEGVWYGEDYAFSKRWRECGGGIWCVPQLNLTHYAMTRDELGKDVYLPYPGNYHRHLARQAGGSLDPQRKAA